MIVSEDKEHNQGHLKLVMYIASNPTFLKWLYNYITEDEDNYPEYSELEIAPKNDKYPERLVFEYHPRGWTNTMWKSELDMLIASIKLDMKRWYKEWIFRCNLFRLFYVPLNMDDFYKG